MTMKVSVITICHNSEKFLSHAIGSVLSQTYPNIEYILIDGKSEDGSVEIIKSFGKVISKWISETDQGIYDAMNKGISIATGDVIGFLHSDDFFTHSQVIDHVVALFESSHADSVYGDIQYVDKADLGKILTNRKSGSFHRWKFFFGWSPPHPTLYIKRELYQKYGSFDPTYQISGDYETILRFLMRHRVSSVYLPEVLVRMRVGGISNRTMKDISRKWHEDYRAMKENNFGNLFTLFLKTMRPIFHFYKSPRYLFE